MNRSSILVLLFVGVVAGLALFFPLTALGDISLPSTITGFNQAYCGPDGYWGDCSMGTYGCPDTVASAGCLITTFAAVLDYYNVNLSIPSWASWNGQPRTGMDPGVLNDWLKAHGGYGRCSDEVGFCCLEWAKLPRQISITTYVNQYDEGLDSQSERIIDQALRSGYPVVCGVHWGSHCHGSTTNNEDCHWIVITGKQGSTYTIIDPYNPDTSDRQGVRTTLQYGTLGEYTIDRFVVVRRNSNLAQLTDLRLSLSFSSEASGTTKECLLSITGAPIANPLQLYIRVTNPHGKVSYAYLRSDGDSDLSYKQDRRGLYSTPVFISNDTFVFNAGNSASSSIGTWTWEVWAEDPAYPGTPYGYSVFSYSISSRIVVPEMGLAIALAISVFIAGIVYVFNVLQGAT